MNTAMMTGRGAFLAPVRQRTCVDGLQRTRSTATVVPHEWRSFLSRDKTPSGALTVPARILDVSSRDTAHGSYTPPFICRNGEHQQQKAMPNWSSRIGGSSNASLIFPPSGPQQGEIVSSEVWTSIGIGIGASRHYKSRASALKHGSTGVKLTYIEPLQPLTAGTIDEWPMQDCTDVWGKADPDLLVGERSIVGMGLLILNSSTSRDLASCTASSKQATFNFSALSLSVPLFDSLHQKLRNLEVNSLKKFAVVTSRARRFFLHGTSVKNLLTWAEHRERTGTNRPLLQYMQTNQDLGWLVHTFQKPLIFLLNGDGSDAGAALAFLANRSAAYNHSSFECNMPKFGWFPDGGLSFVLSRLRGNLGAYLALTGRKLVGPDLYWSGLCRYWMSPEAIPFMELTSEKQLEVSEQDGKSLLEEHFLQPPKQYGLKDWEATIDEHFNCNSLSEVIDKLRQTRAQQPEAAGGASKQQWAAETLREIEALPPIAAQFTFGLQQKLRSFRHALLRNAGISPAEWKELLKTDRMLPHTPLEDSKRQVVEAVDEQCLIESFRLEYRVAEYLLAYGPLVDDIRSGFEASLTGKPASRKSQVGGHASSGFLSLSKVEEILGPEAPDGSSVNFRTERIATEFSWPKQLSRFNERSQVPLSTHPLLRRLHPDFDETTGFDHNPATAC